jgi:hypothetical protein
MTCELLMEYPKPENGVLEFEGYHEVAIIVTI